MKFNQYYKDILTAAVKNSSCLRVQVAAAVVKDGRILVTGWNGSLPRMKHCNEYFTEEDMKLPDFYEIHGKFSAKYESHAEVSAIAFAAREGIKIGGCDMIVSHTPCLPCAKTIVMAGIKRVFYLEKYDRDPEGFNLIQEVPGLEIIQL